MRFLRKSLEAFNEANTGDEQTIELKGPLSEVYAKALNTVYAKADGETVVGDTTGMPQANSDLVDNVAIESADKSKPKKKKLNIAVKKGAFHEWLGKKPGDPITDKDIEKGLKSKDPKVKRMAIFAKNAKKWHEKKVANESFTDVSLENYSDNLASHVAQESQQMDSVLLERMAKAVGGGGDAPPTDNFTTVYGVNKSDLAEDDVVDLTSELANNADDGKFVLVIDACNPGDNGTTGDVTEKSELIGATMESMVMAHHGQVFHNFNDAVSYLIK